MQGHGVSALALSLLTFLGLTQVVPRGFAASNSITASVNPVEATPLVSILSPADGATASHVIVVSAIASEAVSVLSVEFFADGITIGEDAREPYAVPWNTTTLSNGLHVLSAVAADAEGNRATSGPVTIRTLNPAFVNEVVVPGIVSATTIAFLPDRRMLIGELTGTIWVVQPEANQPDPTPFLQLDNSELFGEQGLMDMVLDPDFVENGYIYLFYTRGFPGQNNRDRVSRFTVAGNTAAPDTEFLLWQDDAIAHAEHHGGALAFGPEGMLYITLGEHFNANDAQRLDSYRGKLLRIDRDGSVPSDNPFFDNDGPNKDEIWALGLRNPFRMSADPVTGRMFVGDVGGNDNNTSIEEINLVIRGANYGWPMCEGYCGVPGTTDPLFSYSHSGRDASVTGGFVYRGSQFPSDYHGSYFFADYSQNWIKRLSFDTNGNVATLIDFEPPNDTKDGPYGDPVKLIEGPDGSIYYVDIGFNDAHVPNEATIRRIRYITNRPPVAIVSATPTAGLPPLQVVFSSTGSFDPEGLALSHSWTFGDGASSTEENPTHTYTAPGPYVARLTISDAVNTVLSSNLIITVGNPPAAIISSPVSGKTFRAGDVINFTGSATDVEDGELPPSRFSWSIFFHHEGHIHPASGPFTNTNTGTLQIPSTGHDFSGATSYELILSVTDSDGLRGVASVTVFPEKVDLFFDTIPTGLSLDLDGIRKTTPFTQDALIGFQYTIGAPEQSVGTSNYQFAAWSDGGSQTHTIVVPPTNRILVAIYQSVRHPDLAAAYSFDEGTGDVLTDVSPNGNHGTIVGATWAAGRFGQALAFDGNGAIVTVSDSPSLSLTNGMTLEAWAFPTSASAEWRDLIYKADDIYYLMGSSAPDGLPATGGTFATAVYSTAMLPVDTWSHVAATYDGAFLRLYIDGLQMSSYAQTGPIQTSNGQLTIGGDAIFGQYWAGLIDEVRIYNRALSDIEIQTDMAISVAVVPPQILTQPQNQIVNVGSNATFTVSATGGPPLSYQWRFNETNIIAGATNETLRLENVQDSDGGRYSVVVSNQRSVTSSIAFLIINHPPIAATDQILRYPPNGTRVLLSTLLSNDSDPDGHPITFVSASPVSINGGSTRQEGDWIYYVPSAGFTNDDSFTYTITDNHGQAATGVVQVNTSSVSSPDLIITQLDHHSYRLRFNGVPGLTYRIEYAEEVSLPNWQTLGSRMADEVGLFEIIDAPPAGSLQRWYRAAHP